jgi:4-hydroxy-tetrahydrodipicolinate reductase
VRILLNGAGGKVGSVLGPALLGAGHELVASEAQAEAMVDFTTPGAVVGNILRALAAGVPCVVGTSGWDPDEVAKAALQAGQPVFYAPNFALGAVLMMRFAREASEHFAAVEIVEAHHSSKRDSPSGTARATAALIGGEVPIHSLRLPGFIAHQEVIFGAAGETLTIRHDTSSREAFVPGVELALAKLAELPAGLTVGLEHVL